MGQTWRERLFPFWGDGVTARMSKHKYLGIGGSACKKDCTLVTTIAAEMMFIVSNIGGLILFSSRLSCCKMNSRTPAGYSG
ncbi:hypothetical protein BJX99DRAFT_240540 [Aspergillus californicus]